MSEGRDMECMCIQCGISVYVGLDRIVLEDGALGGEKVLMGTHCPQCGGALIPVGRAGDEPRYRVG